MIPIKSTFGFLGTGQGAASESSLDPCGLRFLLAARHHAFLLRCLPPVQRATLKNQGISTSLLAWAFHSEAQDELLQLLPAFTKRTVYKHILYNMNLDSFLLV